VELVLHRRIRCLSSAAVLEMALAALRAVDLSESAETLEQAHLARLRMRSRLIVRHDDSPPTAWSKDWLVQQMQRKFGLGRTTARILAAKVERDMLCDPRRELTRGELADLCSNVLGAFGLESTALASEATAQAAPGR
jgi:hypothetical protein